MGTEIGAGRALVKLYQPSQTSTYAFWGGLISAYGHVR